MTYYNAIYAHSDFSYIKQCRIICVPVSLQFTGGCGDVLRDLGQLQVGAVHNIWLTAAFRRTHWITVTDIIQMGVLCAWKGENVNRHNDINLCPMSTYAPPLSTMLLITQPLPPYSSRVSCCHLKGNRTQLILNLGHTQEHPAAFLTFGGERWMGEGELF